MHTPRSHVKGGTNLRSTKSAATLYFTCEAAPSRLKLVAAFLAAKLSCELCLELDVQFDWSYLWTDAAVVLRYICNAST